MAHFCLLDKKNTNPSSLAIQKNCKKRTRRKLVVVRNANTMDAEGRRTREGPVDPEVLQWQRPVAIAARILILRRTWMINPPAGIHLVGKPPKGYFVIPWPLPASWSERWPSFWCKNTEETRRPRRHRLAEPPPIIEGAPTIEMALCPSDRISPRKKERTKRWVSKIPLLTAPFKQLSEVDKLLESGEHFDIW